LTEHQVNLAQPAGSFESAGTTQRFNPWRGMQKQNRFFQNDEVAALIQRGLFYARAGVPIHFQGTAGRGKTAIAMEIAHRLGRTVSVLTGNDWLGADQMIGKHVGQSTTSLVDKYIQRVRRSEATVRHDWENAILAEAMLHGHTLVYDEFTRSNAKANGILLSVLEEGVLISSDPVALTDHIEAHPDFRIILTSNPHDYAGVNASPDALLDRMITFQMARFSPKTEAGIVAARTGVSSKMSERIVTLLRDLIKNEGTCSMRAAIMIGQIAAMRLRSSDLSDALLAQIAADVLQGRGVSLSTNQIASHLTKSASRKVTS